MVIRRDVTTIRRPNSPKAYSIEMPYPSFRESCVVQTSQPRFLMCPPRHFAVTYSINPWMDPQAWADGGAELYADAQRQWASL